MTKRNPILVVALTFITFTVYAYYWLYKTTDELREECGREELRPIVDVILAVLTFGLWGLYAAYRNSKIAHELFEEMGAKHTDRSVAVAVISALSFVSGGWAWLIAMALVQDDLNRLAGELDEDFVPVRPRARVEVPPCERAAPTWDAGGAGEAIPSNAIFVSNAPAPNAY